MSTWRQKALNCLPELKKEIENPDTSIYDVFMELLSATIEAHRNNNNDRLKSFYEFAEWCFRQKEKDLWNSAGVSFYEHLGDAEETLRAIPHWVKTDIYNDIRGLLELRINKTELEKLDKSYSRK